MEFVIRQAAPSEYDIIGELTVGAYDSIPNMLSDDRSFYADELGDVSRRARSSEIIVAVRPDGEVLGAVALVLDETSDMAEWDEEGAAGFRMLAVSPAAQGLGVGKALALHCIERAREAEKSTVLIHTTDLQKTAIGLYENLGFVRDPSFDIDMQHTLLIGFRFNLT